MRCSVSALLGRWHGRRCRKIQQWRPEGVQEEHSQARELVEEVEEQGPLCLCPLHRLVLCLDPCLAPSVSSHCWSVSVASALRARGLAGSIPLLLRTPMAAVIVPTGSLMLGFSQVVHIASVYGLLPRNLANRTIGRSHWLCEADGS